MKLIEAGERGITELGHPSLSTSINSWSISNQGFGDPSAISFFQLKKYSSIKVVNPNVIQPPNTLDNEDTQSYLKSSTHN